jgi:hypothetical protein
MGNTVVVHDAVVPEIACVEQFVIPVNVVPLIEYWKPTVPGPAFVGSVAVSVTEVPTNCGEAGVAEDITTELVVDPAVTVNG